MPMVRKMSSQCFVCGTPANLQVPGYHGDWCWKHLPEKKRRQISVTAGKGWYEFLSVTIGAGKAKCGRRAYENVRKWLDADPEDTIYIGSIQRQSVKDIDLIWVDGYEDVLLLRR